MAAGKSSSVCSAGVIDIVCGTLQVKLLTDDLSSGCSHCIQFGSLLLSPCKFQHQAGKATARNWKNSIRYQDQPLSQALENYIDPDGKRCCCFIGPSVASGLDIPPNSQLPGISLSVLSTGDVSSSVYQPETEPTSQPEMSPSDNVRLPEFQPVAPSHFHWGPVDSSAPCQSLDSTYQEVVHWKKNNFEVPRGSVGMQFVSELAWLFRAIGEGLALESITLKAVFLACALLLQKPFRTCKSKEHSTLLTSTTLA